MLCVLPNVSSILTDEDMHVAKISLYLDGVTKWRDLSNYPEFGSIKFFPDPAITPFTEVYVLKGDVLELQVSEITFLPVKYRYSFLW